MHEDFDFVKLIQFRYLEDIYGLFHPGHADRLPLPAATGEAGLKYSAKHHLFRAALCHLCLDATDEATALSRYEQLYPQGGDSRECNLLRVGGVCCGRSRY